MIKNEAQYKNTKRLIEQFGDSIRSLKGGKKGDFTKFEIAGMEAQVEELNEEVRVYEALKTGHLTSIHVDDITEIYKVIIQGRIARGLTQKQLAEKLDVAEQQIQRWEATDYESISSANLRQVLDVLRINIPIGRVSLMPMSVAGAEKFDLKGIDVQQVQQAKDRVLQRGELFSL